MAYKISYVIDHDNMHNAWFSAFDDIEEAGKYAKHLEEQSIKKNEFFKVNIEYNAMCVFDNAQEAIDHVRPVFVNPSCEGRMFWAIVEFQNGMFNSVQAPYDSQEEAMDHLDKIKAYRAKNPNPIEYTWEIVITYQPSYVG